MDSKDRQILKILQSDASLSMADLAEKVCLSKTAVWRRVRDLEKEGYIKQQVTIIDPMKVGFGLMVFTLVRTNQHSDKWLKNFKDAVTSIPEVIQFHRTSGDIDYLLTIVAKDMADYDRVYQQLIKTVDLADVSSTFVMETIKSTTELPI